MATELDVRKLALVVVAAVSLLASASSAQPPSAVGFLDEDRCTLTGPLHIVIEEQEQSVLVAQGTALTVTRSGRRFSEVKTAAAQGMVENAALATVCVIERQRCQVERPLTLAAKREPRRDRRRQPAQNEPLPERLRLQTGGGLVVMRRNENSAQVRVGELDATVALADLLSACPELEAAFKAEDAATAATSKSPKKPAATKPTAMETGASEPARSPASRPAKP